MSDHADGREFFDIVYCLTLKIQTIMKERIRINRRMMAWSDGRRVNVVPSEWRKVDDYGSTLGRYHGELREGDENYLACTIVREECRCREYEADRYRERGQHLKALNQMLVAAQLVLPDEAAGFEFEDAQWLNPDEMVFWHPNVREFLRLMRRCEDFCRREPRLRPLLESSRIYRDYLNYLRALGRWVHDA